MSTKNNKIYNCTKCGAQFSKWNGRCLECGGWGTLDEGFVGEGISLNDDKTMVNIEPVDVMNLAKIKMSKEERIVTGISELDRVLGGGLVKGSLILLAGEPGIGKSTILAQMTDAVSSKMAKTVKNPSNSKALYISGEESAIQVRDRFARLNCDLQKIYFAHDTNVDKIKASVLKDKPSLLIIDSIQTMRKTDTPSEAGSINQIRACTASFLELAKQHDVSIIITGHITKDGNIAGPKSLEHIVDTVVYLEHDQSLHYRLLRATKNRFGSINEIGIFEMTNKGFVEVKNPSAVFMNDTEQNLSGTAVSCVMEGTRPFLVEVQALVSKTVFGYPVRKATGIDANRLAVLTAVMQKKANVNLANQDIILNIVGGLKTKETALDLAICAAIISSLTNVSINKQALFLGEVGLGGEIRNVSRIKERLNEALRLGFTEIYTPNLDVQSKKQKIYKVASLSDLYKTLLK